MKLSHVLFSAVGAVLFAAAASAKDIPLSKCPPAVQTTIRNHARNGKIDEVELLRIQGRRMFIAEVEMSADKELKIYVLAYGTLFKTREDILLEDAPAQVREAAQKLVPPGGHVDDVTKTTEAGGKETYEVEIERPHAGDLNVVFSIDGAILSRKEKSKD